MGKKKRARARDDNPRPRAFGPIKLETLMAYDRNLQRKVELNEDLAEVRVQEEEVANELQKLDGIRRFLRDQLVKDKEEEDCDLFQTNS